MNANEMRARFHAARAELDVASKAPALVEAQAEYDKLRAQEQALEAKVRASGAKLNDLKRPVAALQEEMALLCRALRGNTAMNGED